MINNQIYISGAGVVIIQKQYWCRQSNRREDAFIFFRDRKSGEYADGGGKKDKNESDKDCAVRELKEETLNTFRLSTKSLDETHSVIKGPYKIYFVATDTSIESKYYNHNHKIINSHSNVPYEWRETDGFNRIFVKDLVDHFMNPNFVRLNDTKGNPIKLQPKVYSAMRIATMGTIGSFVNVYGITQQYYIQNPVIFNNIPVIQMKLNKKYTPRHHKGYFLNNTICYYT